MPQTREHLEILHLLGVRSGVVALTKADLVEGDWLSLVAEEVGQCLAGTGLAGAPCLPVSAVTGQGLEALKAALAVAVPATALRDAEGFARLPVDRSFSVSGFGTIVTGTLLAGRVRPEDRLELLPGGQVVRVRQVQVHGRKVEMAEAGQRVALNLAGLERAQVARGHVLAAPGSLAAAEQVAVKLGLLPSAPRPLENGQRLRFHTGTSEVIGRLLLLDRESLAPGETAFALFKGEEPLAAARGDRFIMRGYSPVTTLGGGTVVEAGRRFKRYNPRGLEELAALASGGRREVAEAILAEGRPLTREVLARRAGVPWEALASDVAQLEARGRVVLLGDQLLAGPACRALEEGALGFLRDYHRRHPLRRGAPREALRAAAWPRLEARTAQALLQRMAAAGLLRTEQETVALADHQVLLTPAQEARRAVLEDAFRGGGMAPPPPPENPGEEAEVFQLLLDQGVLVKMEEGIFFHREALEAAAAAVRRHLEATGSLTMAELRDLLGTTRKFAVPLGEYFDRIRLTRRVGDLRRLA